MTTVVVAAAGTLSVAVWLGREMGFDPDRTIPLMVSDAAATATAASGDPAEDPRTSLRTQPTPSPAAPEAPLRVPSQGNAAERDAGRSITQQSAAAESSARVHVDRPTFDGRPIRPVKRMSMLVTAYSPDERSCGIHADGITASGYSVWTNGMKLVAADTRLLPFGSIVTIPGYHGGKPVPVLDRGGKIKGNRLDVLYPTHEIARQWGAQRLEVTVWEYAD